MASSKKSHRTRSTILLACLATTFALLIWFKLRIVTGVPRTAYADPNATSQPSPPRPAR